LATHTIAQHFTGRAPSVRATYDRIVSTAATFGPVREEPKKTSIHLARRTAFAGIATRRDALILTLKSAADIASPRIVKRDRASANRWHLEVRLETPQQVDREVKAWLKKAFALAE
jgi:hypothetical protein